MRNSGGGGVVRARAGGPVLQSGRKQPRQSRIRVMITPMWAPGILAVSVHVTPRSCDVEAGVNEVMHHVFGHAAHEVIRIARRPPRRQHRAASAADCFLAHTRPPSAASCSHPQPCDVQELMLLNHETRLGFEERAESDELALDPALNGDCIPASGGADHFIRDSIHRRIDGLLKAERDEDGFGQASLGGMWRRKVQNPKSKMTGRVPRPAERSGVGRASARSAPLPLDEGPHLCARRWPLIVSTNR